MKDRRVPRNRNPSGCRKKYSSSRRRVTSSMPVVTYVPAATMNPSAAASSERKESPPLVLPGGSVPNDIVGLPLDAGTAAVSAGTSAASAPIGVVTDPLSAPGNVTSGVTSAVTGTVNVGTSAAKTAVDVPVDLVSNPLGLVPNVVENIRDLASKTYAVPNSSLASIAGDASVNDNGDVSYSDPGDVPIMMHLHKSYPDTYNPSVYFFTRPQRHDAANQLDLPDQVVMYYGVITDHPYGKRMQECNMNPYAHVRKAGSTRILEEYALDGAHKLESVAHSIASRTRADLGYGVGAARAFGYGQQYALTASASVLRMLMSSSASVVDRVTKRMDKIIAKGKHPEFRDPSFVAFMTCHTVLCEFGRMKMHASYFKKNATASFDKIVDSVDWISLDTALSSLNDEEIIAYTNVLTRITPNAPQVNDPVLAYALLMEFYMGLGYNHMQQELRGRYARPIKDIASDGADARINDTSDHMRMIGGNPLRFMTDAYGNAKPVFIPEYLSTAYLDPERTTQLFNTGVVLYAPRNANSRKQVLNDRCDQINAVLRGILREQGRLGAFPFLEKAPAPGVSQVAITICVLVYLARREDVDFKPFSDALMSEELRSSTYILVDNLVHTVRRDRIPSELHDDSMVLYATLMEFLHGLGPGFVPMPAVAELDSPAGAYDDDDLDEDEVIGGAVGGESPQIWF